MRFANGGFMRPGLLLTIPLLLLACTDREPSMTTDESTGGTTDSTSSTTEPPTGTSGSSGATTADTDTIGTTDTPDPDHVRECQDGDFKCGDWGCDESEVVELGQCYKRCTPAGPDVVGEKDPDCDEPERPFCSQVGLALGGDYSCNDCAFICTSAPVFACDLEFDSCQG